MKLRDIVILEAFEDDPTAGIKAVASDIKAGIDAAKSDVERKVTSRKEAVSKLDVQETKSMKKVMHDFLTRFFEHYPLHPGEPDIETITRGIKTKNQARAASVILRDLSKDLDSVQDGINKAGAKLIQDGGKATERMRRQADLNSDKDPSAETVKFVKSEMNFFKRLLVLDDMFGLDRGNASHLLNAKMKLTDRASAPKAVQELNNMLSNMSKTVYEFAKQVATKASELPDENHSEH